MEKKTLLGTESFPDKIRCPSCQSIYDRTSNLGSHWSKSCEYPDLPDRVTEICEGMLLGDGSVPDSIGHSHFHVGMAAPRFLGWLDAELPDWLSTGVKKGISAEANQERHIRTGFGPNAADGTYSDMYHLRTRAHPEFTHIREVWYPDGEKRFPGELTLTPLMAKLWYCGDGHYDSSGHTDRGGVFHFTNYDESSRYDILKSYFPIEPLETESIRFYADEIIEWFGGPLPGFDHKWPEDMHG